MKWNNEKALALPWILLTIIQWEKIWVLLCQKSEGGHLKAWFLQKGLCSSWNRRIYGNWNYWSFIIMVSKHFLFSIFKYLQSLVLPAKFSISSLRSANSIPDTAVKIGQWLIFSNPGICNVVMWWKHPSWELALFKTWHNSYGYETRDSKIRALCNSISVLRKFEIFKFLHFWPDKGEQARH